MKQQKRVSQGNDLQLYGGSRQTILVMTLLYLLVFSATLLNVAAQEQGVSALLLTHNPVVGTELSFACYGAPAGLRIETPTQVYRYLGAPEEYLTFTPHEVGVHTFTLTDNAGEVLYALNFTVTSPGISSDLRADVQSTHSTSTTNTTVAPPNALLRNPHGSFVNADVIVTDKTGAVLAQENGSSSSTSLASVTTKDGLSVTITPVGDAFGRIVLHDVDPTRVAVGLDKPPRKGLRIHHVNGKQEYAITAAFAIDPGETMFTSGTLTRVATGNALYKCAAWNFTARTCEGSWVKERDLTLGEEYTIPLSSTDPCFVETGVATINAVKPIVETGEPAELVMVVLDTKGALVHGANVDLVVTDPDGLTTTLSTGDDSILEETDGIYKGTFVATSTSGVYDLFVTATGPDVNQSMFSSFTVNDTYAYDIARETPVTIDPWHGPFTSRIRVHRHNASDGLLLVTERLPGELSVIDTGGATLTVDGDDTLLTWHGVTPSTPVTYTVQAPLRTPELFTLGRVIVEGVAGVQEEARSWYLAVDPVVVLKPIVHANSKVGKNVLTAGEVSDLQSDDGTNVEVKKATSLTVELDNISEQIESVEDLDCAFTYYTDSISSPGDFSVYENAGSSNFKHVSVSSSATDNTVYVNDINLESWFDISDVNTLYLYVHNNDAGKSDSIFADYLRCTIDYTPKDLTPPTVSLSTPGNVSYTNLASVPFVYVPADNRDFKNCTLILNNTFNETNTSPIVNNTANNITIAIAEGEWWWNINCSDQSNNTAVDNDGDYLLYVDRTLPTPFTLTSPSNDTVSSDLTPTFAWQATSETYLANYTLLLDDDPNFGTPNYKRYNYNLVSNTTYTFTVIIASNTKYYWKVIAYDKAGNQRTSGVTWTYITDTLAPSAFDLVAPPDGTISVDTTPYLDWGDTTETNFANYTVEFDDDPGFGTVDHEYVVENGTSGSHYQILGGEALGTDTVWYWRVTAYDRAGLSRVSTSTYNYTTDNTGPNITLEAPTPGWEETVTNNLDFNYTVTDEFSVVSTCELVINATVKESDGPIVQGSTQTFTHYLENGLYEWWINCTDAVGNENESTHRFLTVNVSTDSTPPLITPLYPGVDAFVNTTTIVFNYTVQDATGIENCSVYIDDNLNTTNTTVANNDNNTITIVGMSEGVHEWFIMCYDNSTSYNQGNSTARNVTVDSTPPTAFDLRSPPNQTKTNQPVQLLNWSETVETHFANYTVQLDNDSDFSSPEYTYNTTVLSTTNVTTDSLADNEYYWRVIAYDLAGNARASTSTWELSVHTGKPVFTNVTESPTDPIAYNPSRTYNFTVTVVEPHVDTVLFYHDFFGGALTAYAPIGNNGNVYYYTIVGLNASNPNWSYRWWANDTYGNNNQTNAYTYTVNKNTTTTTLYVDEVAANKSVNESDIVNLTGSVDYPSGATVSLRKDGALLTSGASPHTNMYNFTTPGVYEINASYPGNDNYYSSWQAWNVTVLDIYDPVVSLESPGDGDTNSDGFILFTYNVTDSNSIENCSLYINETYNQSMSPVSKGVSQNFPQLYLETGDYTWRVSCVDSAGRTGNSSTYNLTVQINRYYAGLLPINCDAEQTASCTISNINLSDGTYEDHGNLQKNPDRHNYIWANLTPAGIRLGSAIEVMNITWEKFQGTGNGVFYMQWQNGSNWIDICNKDFTSSTTTSPDDAFCNITSYPTIQQLNEGLRLRGDFYYSGNSGGSSFGTDYISVQVQYTEDVTPPYVELDEPPHEQERGAGDIVFNFTATDVNLYNCTLYGDFNGSWVANQTINESDGLTTGVQASFPSIYLDPGTYTWNVLCYDIANNSAFATMNYTLNITPPDLVPYWNYIFFNESNPNELENVTITATIFNEGYTAAENFTVQFWNGDPAGDGVQINGDLFIAYLAGLSDVNVSVNHTALIGPNNIFVVADVYDNVTEISEENNQDNRTLYAKAYNSYYGELHENISLWDGRNETFYSYLSSENITANLFFVRTGTDIHFASLRALGKTTASLNTSDDFSDADTLLNMTTFNDSVNVRWANKTDRPLATQSMVIGEQFVPDVPIIDSDSVGNFVSGILWDTSYDTSSNTEYDTSDKEPLVFTTEVQANQLTEYGLADFMIQVPAPLRSYPGVSPSTITIYYELI